MPVYQICIASPLSPDVAIERIRALTRTPPGLVESLRDAFSRSKYEGVPFLGKIEGQSFRLHRDIRYHNSFLPQIRGNVQFRSSGSEIRVTMFLHPFTAIFMTIWLSFVGHAVWQSLFQVEEPSIAAMLVPLGMFAFGVALTLGGFIPEAIKAKRLLVAAVGESGGGAGKKGI